jgi:hypothetical protein
MPALDMGLVSDRMIGLFSLPLVVYWNQNHRNEQHQKQASNENNCMRLKVSSNQASYAHQESPDEEAKNPYFRVWHEIALQETATRMSG